ncbi:MAG TPA: LytR C-terminal domain-containing protein [Gemmatimonadales bacterium]
MELAPGTRRALIGAGVVFAGIAIVLLARTFRRDRVEGHAFPIPSRDQRVIVEVLNGTDRNGLARLGARRLRRQGFDVVSFGNAESPGVDTTTVLVRRGSAEPAERVRSALGVGTVVARKDTLRRVDVTVILGSDFRPDEDGRP